MDLFFFFIPSITLFLGLLKQGALWPIEGARNDAVWHLRLPKKFNSTSTFLAGTLILGSWAVTWEVQLLWCCFAVRKPRHMESLLLYIVICSRDLQVISAQPINVNDRVLNHGIPQPFSCHQPVGLSR